MTYKNRMIPILYYFNLVYHKYVESKRISLGISKNDNVINILCFISNYSRLNQHYKKII